MKSRTQVALSHTLISWVRSCLRSPDILASKLCASGIYQCVTDCKLNHDRNHNTCGTGRRKEIGILRCGASKRNIANIFNAEFIEGLLSGVFAILFVYLVSIPINAIRVSSFNVERSIEAANWCNARTDRDIGISHSVAGLIHLDLLQTRSSGIT